MTHEECRTAILAREQAKGVVTEAELRQQLADVTNERDELRNSAASIYQRLEICQKQRDNRQVRLNASEARNAEACKLLSEMVKQQEDSGTDYTDDVGRARAFLAQFAPATEGESHRG